MGVGVEKNRNRIMSKTAAWAQQKLSQHLGSAVPWANSKKKKLKRNLRLKTAPHTAFLYKVNWNTD